MYIIFIIFIFFTTIFETILSCPYYPILYGVNTQQELGNSKVQFIRDSDDCRDACTKETSFNCTAFLWPGYLGHCYLFDKVDLSLQIFKDDGEYILYVQSCNETIPSIGYCEFTVNKTGVSYATNTNAQSPGLTTQESCFQFCINKYNGFDYEAFIVSPSGLSNCMLYEDIPQNLSSGTNNLWTKNCHAPPKNCEYTQWSSWSSCSATCNGVQVKTRDVLQEGDPNGVPCLDSEKTLSQNCSVSCDSICTYGTWSSWGECDAKCKSMATRELLTGLVKDCDTVSEPLSKSRECTGGACPTTPAPTTTKAPEPTTTTTTLPPCIFGNWSNWDECDVNCTQSRERPLLSGYEDYCTTINDTLIEIQECTGGLCPPITTTPNPSPTPEEGCRIDNIDSNSRPSTMFKAVGKQESCAVRCKGEKKFTCEAYITAGPGTACILFGSVTKPVMKVSNSVYYMQDINCIAGKTPQTAICTWEKQGRKVNGSTNVTSSDVAYRYYTMDDNHCEQLCNMNHPMFKPEPCGAWVYDSAPGFMKNSPNCYLYQPLTEDEVGAFPSGSGDLYIKKCP